MTVYELIAKRQLLKREQVRIEEKIDEIDKKLIPFVQKRGVAKSKSFIYVIKDFEVRTTLNTRRTPAEEAEDILKKLKLWNEGSIRVPNIPAIQRLNADGAITEEEISRLIQIKSYTSVTVRKI